jgi:hypothetical protein
MDQTWFDDLTKSLATPSSRRQALRRIGGMLSGAILASLPFGHALADNSDCAHFCNSVFAPGPARGQCKSDAAHGTGLCYSCGPASPGGTQPICCPQNPDGTCTSYSSATCCSHGQVCQGGTCVTPTTTTTVAVTTTATTAPPTTTAAPFTTTTTTTTPACLPEGGSCISSTECCSGNCSNNICCAAGLTNCGGTCVNLQNDNNNCGDCSHTCSVGLVCADSQCVPE